MPLDFLGLASKLFFSTSITLSVLKRKKKVIVTVTVTGLHSSTTFSEESCSVDLSEKKGFQLRSELFATVVW